MKALQQLHIKIVLSLIAGLISIASWAQDDTKKIEVDINTKGAGESANSFFMQPWVWVVGGALFILLLVALLRGNRRSD
ncbi:hypothetical protein U0035_09605 [Niabella yanshanensis]|uniref:Uncharacterized protein n=1 Tax=Niabella yanshanensis TaxID=577386 RepID=A0ABZ0WAR6_9BACT|nr:hypothetical protein [Niabella yanshanensis]WQD40400.1 hypothetical protein U0035_09605 [Niabella yanshanensis]